MYLGKVITAKNKENLEKYHEETEMKKNFLCLILIVFIFGGCKPNEADINMSDEYESDYEEYKRDVFVSDEEDDLYESNREDSVDFDEKNDIYQEDAISWSEASDYVGQTETVYGTVKSIRFCPDENGTPIFINIGEDYPSENRLTAVLWNGDSNLFDRMSDEFSDRTVAITGDISLYDNVPQIELESLDQIISY